MTAAPASVGLPFPEGTGKGLKIAVIDSGVNPQHPHICAKTQGVVIGEEHGAPRPDDKAWEDTLGHGTAVTAAIQEKAPEAEYYAVKLFGATLRTTTTRLIEALEWTLAHGMDIVNLSLGTPNLDYQAEVQALVQRAEAAGMVLVAAHNANSHPVLPGMLDGVIGVELDWELPRHRYRVADLRSASPGFFASGYPRSLPGMTPARNLNGISFAVANMTGFVARACDGLSRPGFERVREILAVESRRLAAGL